MESEFVPAVRAPHQAPAQVSASTINSMLTVSVPSLASTLSVYCLYLRVTPSATDSCPLELSMSKEV